MEGLGIRCCDDDHVQNLNETTQPCNATGWFALSCNADYMTMYEAKSVTDIGTAFKDSTATHFREFRLFTSLTDIKGQAFWRTHIAEIYIPEGVTRVGVGTNYALSSSYITKMEFPTTFIGFASHTSCGSCGSLKTLVFKNPVAPTINRTSSQFTTYQAGKNGKIYVPVGSREDYENVYFVQELLAQGWMVVETL